MNIAHVFLRNQNGLAGAGLRGGDQDVGAFASIQANKIAVAIRVKAAIGQDDARQIHFSHRFDDAGAADTHCQMRGLRVQGRVRANRPLVRPAFFANDAESGRFALRVNAHPLDGAGRGAHAKADLRALKGRAGGAGGAVHSLPVAQQNFAVGSYVYNEYHLILSVRFFGNQHAYIIRAHVSRFGGQNVDVSPRMQSQSQFPRFDVHSVAGSQSKRRSAQFHRIDVQQQVDHCGVANNCRFIDLTNANTGFYGYARCQAIKGVNDGGAHFLETILMGHCVRNATHQVFTVSDLRVHHCIGGQGLPASQIAQVSGYGGTANIYRQTVNAFFVTGTRVNHFPVLPKGDSDGPFTLPQRLLQALQGGQVNAQINKVPLLGQGRLQTPPIAAMVAQLCAFYFYVHLSNRRSNVNGAFSSRFANDLLMRPALFWNRDQQIALNGGGAGKARVWAAQLFQKQAFRFAGGRKMAAAGMNAVFLKIALFNMDFALAAS